MWAVFKNAQESKSSPLNKFTQQKSSQKPYGRGSVMDFLFKHEKYIIIFKYIMKLLI